MDLLTHQAILLVDSDIPAKVLARRLAAAGLGVEYSPGWHECRLTIVGVDSGRSCLTLDGGGHAQWLFEPAAGPSTSPVALIAIITYLLGKPWTGADVADYQALPLKGQVGRLLQDQGLTVNLRVTEDWESFEATTDIEVTSPVRPWLGTITLSDDAVLDWSCDWRAAFHGDPVALIDLISPILRHG